MNRLAHALCVLSALCFAACGSSYDPSYEIPVDSKVKPWEAPDPDAEAEGDFLEGIDEEEEPESTTEEDGAKAPAEAAPASDSTPKKQP